MDEQQKHAKFEQALAKFQEAKQRVDTISFAIGYAKEARNLLADKLYEAVTDLDKARRKFEEDCYEIENAIRRRKVA